MRRLARGSVHLPHTPPPESRVTDGINSTFPFAWTQSSQHAPPDTRFAANGVRSVSSSLSYILYTPHPPVLLVSMLDFHRLHMLASCCRSPP
jgi:hypothetical protein